jgi:hypothetical protein
MGFDELFNGVEEQRRRRRHELGGGYEYETRDDRYRRRDEEDEEHEDNFAAVKDVMGMVRRNKTLLIVSVIALVLVAALGIYLLVLLIGMINEIGVKGVLEKSQGITKWLWEGGGAK